MLSLNVRPMMALCVVLMVLHLLHSAAPRDLAPELMTFVLLGALDLIRTLRHVMWPTQYRTRHYRA